MFIRNFVVSLYFTNKNNIMIIKTVLFNGFEDLENPEFYKKNNLSKENIINIQMTNTSYASGFIYYYAYERIEKK